MLRTACSAYASCSCASRRDATSLCTTISPRVPSASLLLSAMFLPIVAVCTAPREVPYIGTSLSSLKNYTDIKPYVFAEPDTQPFPGRLDVYYHEHKTRLGITGNRKHAFNYCRLWGTHVILCEDDIHWHEWDTFVDRVQKYPKDVVSAYTAQANDPGRDGWSIYSKDFRWPFCGALALAVPSCHDVLISELDESRKDVDTQLGKLCLKHGVPLHIHSPTLVTHLGVCSTQKIAKAGSYFRQPLC